MTPHAGAQANAAGECQYVFTSANLIQGSWERPARGGLRPTPRGG
jgi:hypothetical protein